MVLNGFSIVKWNIPYENSVKAIFLEVLVPIVDAGLVIHRFVIPLIVLNNFFILPRENYL